MRSKFGEVLRIIQKSLYAKKLRFPQKLTIQNKPEHLLTFVDPVNIGDHNKTIVIFNPFQLLHTNGGVVDDSFNPSQENIFLVQNC